jgi:hypothetical protein
MSKTQGVETGKRPRRKAPPPTAADEEPWQRSPWRLVRGGAALYRSYAFPTPALAATFSQLAVGLAAHAKLPLFVRLLDSRVTLVLRGDAVRRLSPLAGELFDRLAALS